MSDGPYYIFFHEDGLIALTETELVNRVGKLQQALLAYVDIRPYLAPAVPDSVPAPNVLDATEVTRRLAAADDLAAKALA